MNNLPSSPPIEFTPISALKPVLKVIGLGGGGCNAVNRMIESGLSGVDFIAANTDHQALLNSLAPVKIQLGPYTTRGLGAGGNPDVGQGAAEESYKELAAAIQGADMVFLTAGMGGGTGTGSIPVAAKVARSVGAVTIAIVTTPFSFEMGKRQRNANEGLLKLRPNTDTLISIPNDRLLYAAPRNLPLETAFILADDVLRQAVQGITELITEPGMINVDFAHVRHVMKLGGGALMAIGQGQGDNKAYKAIEQALYHPLLETASLNNAAGILANFTGGKDLTLFEIDAALTQLQEKTGNQAEIVMGLINDDRMEDRTQVILVITGLGSRSLEETLPGFNKQGQPRVEVRVNETPVTATVEQPRSAYAEYLDSHPVPRHISYDAPREPQRDDQPLSTISQTLPTTTSNDLDIPAFLRRSR